MSSTNFDVAHLAELARINLSEKEVVEFTKQLDDIVGYVDQLQAIPTDGLTETAQVTGLHDVLRPDEGAEFSEDELRERRAALLKAAPAVERDMVKVPAIFSEG